MKKVRKKILQMSTKLPKADEFYKKLNRRNWFLRQINNEVFKNNNIRQNIKNKFNNNYRNKK